MMMQGSEQTARGRHDLRVDAQEQEAVSAEIIGLLNRAAYSMPIRFS